MGWSEANPKTIKGPSRLSCGQGAKHVRAPRQLALHWDRSFRRCSELLIIAPKGSSALHHHVIVPLFPLVHLLVSLPLSISPQLFSPVSDRLPRTSYDTQSWPCSSHMPYCIERCTCSLFGCSTVPPYTLSPKRGSSGLNQPNATVGTARMGTVLSAFPFCLSEEAYCNAFTC